MFFCQELWAALVGWAKPLQVGDPEEANASPDVSEVAVLARTPSSDSCSMPFRENGRDLYMWPMSSCMLSFTGNAFHTPFWVLFFSLWFHKTNKNLLHWTNCDYGELLGLVFPFWGNELWSSSYRMMDLEFSGAASAHLPMLKGYKGSSLAMSKMEQPLPHRSCACPDPVLPWCAFRIVWVD